MVSSPTVSNLSTHLESDSQFTQSAGEFVYVVYVASENIE